MADRYDTAAGWDPRKKDPYKRERKLAEKLFPDLTPTPFERREVEPPIIDASTPLFGNLWRRGELAVLMSEPATGKSILAAQLAETIARNGTRNSAPYEGGVPEGRGGSLYPPTPEPQKALLLDLEHTNAQLAERYSVKPLANDDRRIRYEFSRLLDWRTISPDLQVPAALKGDLIRYFRHWVYDAIGWGESDVVIIDSLSRIAKPHEMREVLLGLKHKAALNGTSVLVVAHARAKKSPSPITLADFAGRPEALAPADSVFAIARSYLGPDIRYLKHLSSKSTPLQYDTNSVLLSTLTRMESPTGDVGVPPTTELSLGSLSLAGPSVGSPHVSKGSTQHLIAPNALDALTTNIPQSALHTPQLGAFLGFTFLFTAPEPDVLHPPKIEKTLRPKSSKQTLIDAMTDGSFARYLNR